MLKKVKTFIDGNYYPIFIFLTALISHLFSIEVFGSILIISSGILGLIICSDLRFLISPLIMFILSFSEKSVSSGKFYTTPYIIAIACAGSLIVIALILHFIIYRKSIDFKSIISSKLFLGFSLLSVAFILNGLFNFKEYTALNLVYALVLIASLSFVYLIFTINLKSNRNLKEYLFFVLFLVSILVTIELFFAFTNQIKFHNGEIIKETIKIGWGMWNNIGGLLAFLLPIHFYYATTIRKWGIIFYFSALISYFAIALTLSRSSLLSSTIVIVICALVSCFKGNNKKSNRVMTILIAIFGIISIILLWNKISTVFGDYISRGFDDNGRFELYEHGFWNFISHPIFGGGFYSAMALDYQFIIFLPFRYHNTIIQLIGTCGIIGLLSYSWHRYETIKLFLSKKSLHSLFTALCIGTLLFSSLLDNHFFNLYPGIIYSLLLVVLEKAI